MYRYACSLGAYYITFAKVKDIVIAQNGYIKVLVEDIAISSPSNPQVLEFEARDLAICEQDMAFFNSLILKEG